MSQPTDETKLLPCPFCNEVHFGDCEDACLTQRTLEDARPSDDAVVDREALARHLCFLDGPTVQDSCGCEDRCEKMETTNVWWEVAGSVVEFLEARRPSASAEPEKLPCDVWLPPATCIAKGVPLSTLFAALTAVERPSGQHRLVLRDAGADALKHDLSRVMARETELLNQVEAMRAALEQGAAWFEEYAEQHDAKADDAHGTPEARMRRQKADRNRERAAFLRAALKDTPGHAREGEG